VPTYLAPGVYVEETSFSAPTIEGVGTTTTAFAGPTLTGPIGGMPYGGLPVSGSATAGAPAAGVPQLLTSFGDFQNIYGGYSNLALTTSAPLAAKNINYMARPSLPMADPRFMCPVFSPTIPRPTPIHRPSSSTRGSPHLVQRRPAMSWLRQGFQEPS